MAPHSSTLAWKIPWTEEPGGLQSMGSLRVRHDWAASLPLFTFMHWRRKWQPTPVFLPGESQGWGSLVAAIFGVTQSQTRLKQLSSSSSSRLLLTEFDRLRNWNSETFSNWCNVSELLKEEPGVQSGTSDPCSFSCPELQLSTVRAELQDSRFTLHAFTFIQINPSVFLPGESQGQGSMVGCHLWGRTESDTIEAT